MALPFITWCRRRLATLFSVVLKMSIEKLFNSYVTLRATPFLGDELEKHYRLIFGQMRYVRNLFLQVGFLLLHSVTQGVHDETPVASVSSYCLDLSPSLSHYFSFLPYPFPPPRSRSSSCTFSLGNLFLALSNTLFYHFCSENELIPKFRQFQGRWRCATRHSFEHFLNLCYLHRAL